MQEMFRYPSSIEVKTMKSICCFRLFIVLEASVWLHISMKWLPQAVISHCPGIDDRMRPCCARWSCF